MQNFNNNIGFEKNANFCRKLSKIAENCDHNIDPWLDFTKDLTWNPGNGKL
jgi:hypothetical protein